ncbi:MAG: hypothetical protein PWQ83_1095 [Thermosipho sp. (in: thermotogales)]|nr:hypothetical protein [Thermosipho sp. (in: thermotogales)]
MDLLAVVDKKGWKIYRSNGTLYGQKEMPGIEPIRILLSCIGKLDSNHDWRKANNRTPINYSIILNNALKKEEALALKKRVNLEKSTRGTKNWRAVSAGDYIGVCASKITSLKVAVFYGTTPIIEHPYFTQSNIEEVS